MNAQQFEWNLMEIGLKKLNCLGNFYGNGSDLVDSNVVVLVGTSEIIVTIYEKDLRVGFQVREQGYKEALAFLIDNWLSE